MFLRGVRVDEATDPRVVHFGRPVEVSFRHTPAVAAVALLRTSVVGSTSRLAAAAEAQPPTGAERSAPTAA